MTAVYSYFRKIRKYRHGEENEKSSVSPPLKDNHNLILLCSASIMHVDILK